MPGEHEVVVYSRQGCHLCDVVKQQLQRLVRHADFRWTEVDIDADPELRRQYNEEVPVIFIDGRKAFKYRFEDRDFLRRLSA